MKRTAYAIDQTYDGHWKLFHGFPITCQSTGEMADGTKVWTSDDIPGCWFSFHRKGKTPFFVLEGVN